MKWKIGIALLSAVLLMLLIVAIILTVGQKENHQNTQNQNTQTDDSDTADALELHLGQELYIVRIGNYVGRFVEDGSNVAVDSVGAVVVENRSQQTVQLAQFRLMFGTDSYEFSLTTLPPGARVTVQEKDKKSLISTQAEYTATLDVLAYFQQEPSLHTDSFAITQSDCSIEVRNLTNSDIIGPIYLYYKSRTTEGYFGGITYRVTIPTLKAGESYQAYASHFREGSSQVMFVDYAV